jgi:hypothetical protein
LTVLVLATTAFAVATRHLLWASSWSSGPFGPVALPQAARILSRCSSAPARVLNGLLSYTRDLVVSGLALRVCWQDRSSTAQRGVGGPFRRHLGGFGTTMYGDCDYRRRSGFTSSRVSWVCGSSYFSLLSLICFVRGSPRHLFRFGLVALFIKRGESMFRGLTLN